MRPDQIRVRMLGVADCLAAVGASASLARAPGVGLDGALWALLVAPIWLVLARLHGLYDHDRRSLRHLTVDEVPSVLVWSLTATGLVAILMLATPTGSLPISAALQLWAVAAGGALLLRALARMLWRQTTRAERAIIVGNGSLAHATRRKLELFPDIHARIVGHIADPEELLAHPELLEGAERVICASAEVGTGRLESVLVLCRRNRVRLVAVLSPFSGLGSGARLHHLADLPIVTYEPGQATRAASAVKRGLDLVLASVALLVLVPLMVVIALVVRLESKGPVIFAQERSGLGGRRFHMLKFRTMVGEPSHAPKGVALLPSAQPRLKIRPDDARITRVGRLLRRTSLDELPQLWNVLRGEMSLVGPRPELAELVERWPPEHQVRLSVKPGLTGPMQVYGRSDLTFEEWLAVEQEYIENRSIWRDLRIIALTIPAMITGRGAY